MVTVNEFSRLVEGIYSAALSPRNWEYAIRDIYHAMGGTSASLLGAEGVIWSTLTSTVSEKARESYADHYCRLDHVLACVSKGPVGAVRTGTELVVPNRKSEFYTGWLKPNELEDGLFVKLRDAPRPICFIVASDDRTTAFDTPVRVKLMTGLVPHLQQALRTHDKIAMLDDRLQLAGALDMVRHGVLVVGPNGRVVNVNSTAELILRAGDGLQVRSRCVEATSKRAERQLQLAIHSALTHGASKIRSGRSLTCERSSGKPPFVLHVVPLQHTETGKSSADARAVVVVIDPECDPDPAAALRRLHGLTNSEAQVAVRLMRGADLRQISDELSLSLTTVRTHLQHVFEKTDTHRQAELVRHLLTRH